MIYRFWVEDEHLGAASNIDSRTLPEMLVYGHKLIEKYAGATCL